MRSALVPILLPAVPGWVRGAYGLIVPDAVSHLDEGRAWVRGIGSVDPVSLLATIRAGSETTLVPASAAGVAYQTVGSNIPAVVAGVGLQSYQATTNLLLNSAAPVTQTTASLGTGTYTLWVNGSGTATSSAGTAVGSGFGAASNGTPNTFTLTGAGTVTVTKSGSLNAFQLEAGSAATPLVVTAGVTATRPADNIAAANPFKGGDFTIMAKVSGVQAPSGSFPTIVGIDDGGGTNFVLLYIGGAGTSARGKEFVSSVSQFDTSAGSMSGGAVRVAMTRNGTAVRGVTNGGAASSLGTWAAITGLNRMTLGSQGGGNPLNGYLARLAFFNAGMTDAQMQSVTA